MKQLFLSSLVILGITLLMAACLKLLLPSSQPSYSESSSIVLYSARWCGYCDKARAYLQEQQVSFTELDIETSPRGRQEFAQLGGGGIPLMKIDSTLIRGYNPQAISYALRSHSP